MVSLSTCNGNSTFFKCHNPTIANSMGKVALMQTIARRHKLHDDQPQHGKVYLNFVGDHVSCLFFPMPSHWNT